MIVAKFAIKRTSLIYTPVQPRILPSYLYNQYRWFCSKDKPETEESKEPKDEEALDEENSSDEEITIKVKEIKKLLIDQDTEIESLQKDLANAKKLYSYQVAENDNTVKRYKDEVEKSKDYAITKFAQDLLEVRDNLQLAVNHSNKYDYKNVDDIDMWKKEFGHLFNGVTMTSTVFDKIMKKYKVEEYNPKGEKFNTDFHEAIYMVDGDVPDTVADVIQTGWKIGDRILRAAKVGIVKKK